MYIPRINSGLKAEVLCLHKLHHALSPQLGHIERQQFHQLQHLLVCSMYGSIFV